MATELAKAYVQIIPSAVGIQGRIQKEIEPEADSAGSSFGGKMVGMIKKGYCRSSNRESSVGEHQ